MKINIPRQTIWILLSCSWTLSACGTPPVASPTPVVTTVPTATSVATPIPQPTNPPPMPTATPLPPTPEAPFQEDPATWQLQDGQADPNNPGYTLYTLTDPQQKVALQPIREFFDLMYHSNKLLTPDQASKLIDKTSQAWTDKDMGFQASYDSFEKVGYYPYYEFPIEDNNHYTEWRVNGVKGNNDKFYVVVNFRMEEQKFTVYNQVTQKEVVSSPFMGPYAFVFRTSYGGGKWQIIYRLQEDLGSKLTPTP
jgi:hypothetical protein